MVQSGLTFSVFGHAVVISSATLLAIGTGLLILAAFLLFFARRHRVALQRSLVSDELMLHLSRIADALERQAARPVEQTIVEALRQADRPAQPKPNPESRTIPYSIFGREFQQEH